MDKQQRQDILTLSWSLHDEVEQAVLKHPASKTDKEWPQKQRLLLADMALHLLHTALKPGELQTEKLTHNLNAILTLSDDFISHVDLKAVSDKLYQVEAEHES
ncbi:MULTISPECIES: hypothetical protein [Pseudoalteromonas]|uniref:Uncharacterized protein n=1 Tax=Pseudoalteromonas amylolytica TaxID=1859457 RepID=A0A1S1MZW3_9GAMM|nr:MULTISPECIES: hypothetical protein [Pseudoalteromonas]MCF6434214.1 hypothetical protein [Pseudoalteromonas sp. MMG022]OHU87886.1 hypothetical protein BFC16_10775 [Pseudoalteromonas sp. JW3]OHU91326.1 hypothetical protein BET10_10895 [Pseudoalteromonas amylolytica]